MTRQNALLRLHRNLLERREGLDKTRAGDLANLRDFRAADSPGDSADLAFDADGDQMSSRLAQLEDKELSQIERALVRWEQGMYGICDGGSSNCQKKIPVARLDALPYTPFCINCEREMEMHPDGPGRQSTGNGGQITDVHPSELEWNHG